MVDIPFGLDLSWPDMLEMGMLLCFGICWPISIARMLRSRRREGKSIGFVAAVLVGYLFGIASKIAYAAVSGSPVPPVTLLYAVNCVCVAVDGLVCVYFRRHPRARPCRLASLAQPHRLRDAESA
jgi:hypothetical protein